MLACLYRTRIGETVVVSQLATPKSLAPWGGVFGGGGLFGIGYAMGVLDGLKEKGLSFTNAPLLGTSAGSWAATATVLNVSFTELSSMKVPSFPNPKPGLLAAIAQDIFGERSHSHIHVMACALPRLSRTKLSGADYPLSQLIAASSAVPGLLAPQKIGDTKYVDGGVRSGTSVDFGPDANRLLVIAPLAGAMWGPFARFVDRAMHNEIRDWKTRTGGTHILFTPRENAAHIARNPKHLFDKHRAIEAYQCGLNEAKNTHISM